MGNVRSGSTAMRLPCSVSSGHDGFMCFFQPYKDRRENTKSQFGGIGAGKSLILAGKLTWTVVGHVPRKALLTGQGAKWHNGGKWRRWTLGHA